MKRIIPLLVLMIVCCAGMAQAQRLKEADDQLDKQVLSVNLTGPQMAVLEMKRELNLNEEQLAQVEKLNEERFQLMTEAEATVSDPLQLQRQFRDIQIRLDKSLAKILNDKQLHHYLELEGRQFLRFLTTGNEDED